MSDGAVVRAEIPIFVAIERETPVVVTSSRQGEPGPPGVGGGLPTGGGAGDVLTKNSVSAGDAGWQRIDNGYF